MATDDSDRDAHPRRPTALAVAVWLWALACLPFVTDAGAGFGSVCVLAPVGVILAILWCKASHDRYCFGFGRRDRVRVVATWALAGLAFPWVGGLSYTDLDFAVRVAASERELLAAAELIGPEGSSSEPRVVGLFLVQRVDRSADGRAVAFETVASFLNGWGPLYLPPGSSPPARWRQAGHLFGDWYVGYLDYF